MNSHIIVGTAGHIDHGKTAFIRHLTGIETDRLKDEKARGITIENGYAHLELPSGVTIGFVDVPGHERFIKTMLAGAMGIDAVILIVSAEEGIKSQTVEHFNIIKHLKLSHGFVLITKCDLVDTQTLSLLEADIKKLIEGSCFEEAQTLHYSIYDDVYKTKAIEALENLSRMEIKRKDHVASRLNIDRLFSVKGFGTVVTGTLIEGQIAKGDVLVHYPSGKKCRVKGVQVYGETVEKAEYGQRTALNIALDMEEVEKGDTLTSFEGFMPTMIVDVLLKTDALDGTFKEIKHWQRLKLYHGTREILCRIVIGSDVAIGPNESHKVQLRLESPLFCKANDPFIIRSYSPMWTLGGGMIVTPHAKKRIQLSQTMIEDNLEKDELLHFLKRQPFVFTFEPSLFESISLTKERGEAVFMQLLDQGEVVVLKDNKYLLSTNWNHLVDLIITETMGEHKTFPLRAGIPKETLKSKISLKIHNLSLNKSDFAAVLEKLKSNGLIVERASYIAIKEYKIEYTQLEKTMIHNIVEMAKNHPQGIFAPDDLLKLNFNKNVVKEMLYHLINYEILVKINDETIMSTELYNTCIERLIEFFNSHSELTVAEYRDLIGYSRKAAVILLEHFDKIQMTKRNENTRTLIKK